MNILMCSHCGNQAIDYDVLFHPWCNECKIRKWLVNWGAQHQWLHESFMQLNKKWSPTKEQWVNFAISASLSDVERLWLRIAIFEKKMHQQFLGIEYPRLSLPPSDQDTPYGNTVFRNVWEAKWACFFKTLQIQYEYRYGVSYQSIDLPASTVFWLPDVSWYQQHQETCKESDNGSTGLSDKGAYFIITGPTPHVQEPERYNLACQFAIRTHKAVYLLEGKIGFSTHWDGTIVSRLDPLGHQVRPLNWFECLECGTIGLFHPLSQEYQFCSCTSPHYRNNTPRILQAYVAARYKQFRETSGLPAPIPKTLLLS